MLFNKTQNQKIIEKTRLANSFSEKFKGLMFERKERFDYGLIFDFGREATWEVSIHMLFVFFPIDLVYLNEQKKIVDIKLGIKPWALNYTPQKPARYLAELPAGIAQAVRLGDQLEWEN